MVIEIILMALFGTVVEVVMARAGFGALGPRAGSLAAKAQSFLHPIGAKSVLAVLRTAGVSSGCSVLRREYADEDE